MPRISRFLLIILVIFLVISGLALIIVTRPPVLRAVLIPSLQNRLGVAIQVDQIRFNPFGSLLLQDVVVQRQDQGILFRAELLRGRYRLLPLLINGRLHLTHLTLSNGLLRISEPPTSAPVANDQGQPEQPAPAAPAAPAAVELLKLPALSIDSARIDHFNIVYDSAQGPALIRLNDAGLQLDKLQPGETASITWQGAVQAHTSSAIKISGGLWQGNASLQVDGDGSVRSLQINSELASLLGTVCGVSLAAKQAIFTSSLTVLPATALVQIQALRLQIADGEQLLSALSAEGSLDLSQARLPRIDLEVSADASARGLAALVAALPARHRLNDQATLAYRAKLQGYPLQEIALKGLLSMEQWQLAPTALTVGMTEPATLRISHQLRLRPNRIETAALPATAPEPAFIVLEELNAVLLRGNQGESVIARLAASATVPGPEAATPAQLQVTASDVDLLQWQQLLAKPTPDATAAPVPPPAEPTPRPALPILDPTTPTSGAPLHLAARLELKNWFYNDLHLADASADLLVHQQVLSLRNLSATSNLASLTAAAQLDYNLDQWGYQAEAKLANMLVEPLLRSFWPQLAESLDAVINSVSLSLQGHGFSPAELKRHLNASLSIDVADLAIQNVPWLEKLALVLQQPELKDLRFRAASMTLQASNGQVLLPRASLRSEDLVLVLNGTMGFDLGLDVKLLPGLNAELLAKANNAAITWLFSEVKDGYHYPLVPLQIEGTLLDPKLIVPYKKLLVPSPSTSGAWPDPRSILPWLNSKNTNANGSEASGAAKETNDREPLPQQLLQQLLRRLPDPK